MGSRIWPSAEIRETTGDVAFAWTMLPDAQV